MFGKSFKLFTIFGYEVRIDISWLILAVLIIWMLAQSYFPAKFQNLSTMTYIWMGIGGAIGLFLSIIFHELSHSLVGRRYGIPISGITLFIFGGAAQMAGEPKSPKAEFLMAIAGPVSSVIIAGAFYAASLGASSIKLPSPVSGVLAYLAVINLILAGFNLLPAFPLDGGRALRAILWNAKKSLKWATRISSRIGSAFGIGLIVLGILAFFAGDLLGGIWMVLIGMFLNSIAKSSYDQYLLKESLAGKTVEDFVQENPVSVPPSTTIDRFIDDYVLKYHFKDYPVESDSLPVSCMSLEQAKSLPRQQWDHKTVGELAERCTEKNSIESGIEADKALSMMMRAGKNRLLVVDGNKLRGVVNLRDMMEYLSLRKEIASGGR
jgi:Zn-dependent protease